MPDFDLPRRLVAEALGTALLVATVVGSGIMAESLTKDVALALLGNTLPTGAILVVLITILGPISGAHFNPVVTLASAVSSGLARADILPYILAEFAGAFAGTVNSHFMFGLQAITYSRHARSGPAQFYAEIVATFGLIAVISTCAKLNAKAIPVAVGGYIGGAYWFTSSTSFANPAVTLARCFTDSFAGIRPRDVPGFVVAETLGAALAFFLFRWLIAPRISAGSGASP